MAQNKVSLNLDKDQLELMDSIIEENQKNYNNRTQFIRHAIARLIRDIAIEKDVKKARLNSSHLTPTEKRLLKLRDAINDFPDKHLTEDDLKRLISDTISIRDSADYRTHNKYIALIIEHGLLFTVPGFDIQIYTKPK